MIADVIRQMQALARKAQEEAYDGICTVMEQRKVKDPKTMLTTEQDVVVVENEPCHLSYSNVSAVSQTEAAANTAQVTRLFLSPDVRIRPGAKIAVTQAGTTQLYGCSGVPAVYRTHQEIVLTLSGRYA